MDPLWITHPVVEARDASEGAVAAPSSFPLGVVFGEKLHLLCFLLLFTSGVFTKHTFDILQL